MVFKDYYKILGLENSKCTMEQIKSAYRHEAKKHHPDINVGNQLSEEKIKDINEAYRILSDKTLRKQYDRKYNSVMILKNSIFGTGKKRWEILYEMFFGENYQNSKKIETKKKNIETKIEINVKDGYNGCTKQIYLKALNKKIDVKIPKGITNNETIVIPIGKSKNDEFENLILTIKLSDYKNYKFKDNKIQYTLKITPIEAICGTTIEIENLDNSDEQIEIQIDPLTSSSKKYLIENKGYLYNESSKIRQDLEVEVEIVCPQFLTSEEKKLYSQLNKLSKYCPR